MEQNIVLTGMVLKAMPIGEYDKRITVLTKERGKITAFARGARRPTSQLLAVTGPFSFGEFEFFKGRSTYNLKKASITNYFRELSADPMKACYGFYFLELADYYAQENNNEKELLKLLYQTLRALEHPALNSRLIRRIYELRVLLAEGEYPDVFSCRKCRTKENLTCFSIKNLGMVCETCKTGADEIRVDESTLYTMQYILSSQLQTLYTFTVSKEVLCTLEKILNLVYAVLVEHEFHSLKILEALK